MQADFWHQRWQDNKIGFHQSQTNPFLVKHLTSLSLAPDSRIFIPLCGKTLDIAYLLQQGYRVVGIELSPLAIDQLFESLQLTPTIKALGSLVHYHANNLDIYIGDIFHLDHETLGQVDAIYDRAALVALPMPMRLQYTQHLVHISRSAKQLLVTFSYDQRLIEGPPFSITPDHIQQYYQAHYQIQILESQQMADGLKGQWPATEQVYLLS